MEQLFDSLFVIKAMAETTITAIAAISCTSFPTKFFPPSTPNAANNENATYAKTIITAINTF